MKTRFLKLALKDRSAMAISDLYKVVFCIVLYLFSFHTQLNAQPYKHPIFDSLELVPSNPTPNNDIKLVCHTTLALSPGSLDSSKVIYQSNNIDLSLYFDIGNLMADFDRIDTINIGQLSAGNYYLGAYAYSYNNSLSFTNSDTAYINFTVRQESVGLKEQENDLNIRLFPNPVNNKLNFNFDASVGNIQLEIYDIAGRKINDYSFADSNNENQNASIDVSALNKGLYFCKFSSENQQITRKFIKK